MKKISILIPCLNEEGNVPLITQKIEEIFENELSEYDYELIFIDNYSTDRTRDIIRVLCSKNSRIKAIFNTKNFGPSRSPVYGLTQTGGDCAIMIPADLQVPPELIPQFVAKWEGGHRIVIAQKSTSKENPLMFFCRKVYYKLFNVIGDIEHIEHFAGFGLYDKKFIELLSSLEEPEPYIRGLVTEFESDWDIIEFTEPKRQSGHTKTNFFSLYDTAMLGFTSYSKAIPRYATLIGFVISAVCIVIAIVFLVLKLVFWQNYPMGYAPILISVFGLSGIQLFFLGLLGEYIMRINTRVSKRPLVTEEERINF